MGNSGEDKAEIKKKKSIFVVPSVCVSDGTFLIVLMGPGVRVGVRVKMQIGPSRI